MVFLQLLINSIISGSIYALVASGFSLIFSTNKYLHLAHGVAVVIGAYILFATFNLLGIPFYLAAIVTIILTSLIGLVMNKVIYQPLQKKNASNVILLIAGLGLLILFQNIIQLIFGSNVKTIGFIEVSKGIEIGSAVITPLQIVIFIISILLLVGLHSFMKFTRLGRNMRAVSDNKELADIIGINHKKISDISYIIGSALAGVAGILIGLEQNLFPSMGTTLIIKGFTGAVIGGIESVPGAILGSYLLGVAENFGIWYLPSGYKDAIAFVLLFIFLLFRPQGIFGINKGVKK